MDIGNYTIYRTLLAGTFEAWGDPKPIRFGQLTHTNSIKKCSKTCPPPGRFLDNSRQVFEQ